MASSRAHPPAAAAAPARASRPRQQPGGRPGGREPGGVGSHLLGEVGRGVALCVGAREGLDCGYLG